MTKKEKLYKEYVIAHNKYCELSGKVEDKLDDSEEFFASHNFQYFASSFTKAELERKIEYAKCYYEHEVEKIRTENYFNTEEGRKHKDKLEAAKEEYMNMRETCIADMEVRMNAFIKEWLGEEWGCGIVGNTNMQIGIVEEVKNGHAWFVFGHTFSVYYDTPIFDKDRRKFRMNYGTMGSFDIFDNPIRTKYVIGMGEFLRNTENLEILKSSLYNYASELERIEDILDKITCELKNPFKKLFNC